MLVRKREPLDRQEVSITEYAIEIDRQAMGGQFRVQAGTHAPETMGMVGINLPLRNTIGHAPLQSSGAAR